MWIRVWIVRVVVSMVVVAAGCKPAPSCETRMREALRFVELARAGVSDVRRAQSELETATLRLSKLQQAVPAVPEAIAKAEAVRDAIAETLRTARGRGVVLERWHAALTRGVKIETAATVAGEPQALADARARIRAVQACLR